MNIGFKRIMAVITVMAMLTSTALCGCSSSKADTESQTITTDSSAVDNPTGVRTENTGATEDKGAAAGNGIATEDKGAAAGNGIATEDKGAAAGNGIATEDKGAAAGNGKTPEDKGAAAGIADNGAENVADSVIGDDNSEASFSGMTDANGANPFAGMGGENGGGFDWSMLKEGLANGTITIKQIAEMSGMPEAELEALLGADGSNIDQLSSMFAAASEPQEVGELALPEGTDQYSAELASQALLLCTGNTKKNQAAVFEKNGFEVIAQVNYEKAAEDASHTCAYSVGRKTIVYQGQDRTLLIIAIRGTNKGEWFSNFDYSESHDDDSTIFAENFLSCAQAVSVELIPIFMENPDALILICGHSRGAAAANLLGMLLNETKSKDSIFCYTFATPNTYRGTEPRENCENIFNIINPCDIVTRMPLTELGFSHVGTDIMLPADSERVAAIDESMSIMFSCAPTIRQYYEERHSLTGPGLSEDGMTAYEVMLAMGASMTRIKSAANGGLDMQDLYAILDANPLSTTGDLAPLFGELRKLVGSNGSLGMSIFAQHMPSIYLQLLNS